MFGREGNPNRARRVFIGMTEPAPQIVWFRRDLRLADHAPLCAAAASGGAVIPVFVLDPETEALGAAPKWRLGLSIADLAARLQAMGSRLVLRRGPAFAVLRALAAETGAGTVRWTRLYAPEWAERDQAVKAGLAEDGLEAVSHPGHLIHEPWSVRTKAGGFYKVFTPFWREIAPLGAPEPLRAPDRLATPKSWPESDRLEHWGLGAAMGRGADVVAKHVHVGEAAALDRLDAFIARAVAPYAVDRDRPDLDGSSGLSENLTYGEISPRTIWHAGQRAMEQGAQGAQTFLKELAWREFAWHLAWHSPQIAREPWRPEWRGFPWRSDNADAERWRRGMTGEPLIDAGMRQLYVTGRVHNRIRMLVGSYLTKHLLTHWRVGLDWFADCLIDWDPASNALGWQWVAGCGPDSTPYARVFNPRTQAEKFDPEARYRRRFLLGFDGSACEEAQDFFHAAPKSWGLRGSDPYPSPIVDLKEGREAALAAHRAHSASRKAGAA